MPQGIKASRLKDMLQRLKHYVYYLEHLVLEFAFTKDNNSKEKNEVSNGGESFKRDDTLPINEKYLKHTYLYRCLMECRVTLSTVEHFIITIN